MRPFCKIKPRCYTLRAKNFWKIFLFFIFIITRSSTAEVHCDSNAEGTIILAHNRLCSGWFIRLENVFSKSKNIFLVKLDRIMKGGLE